MKLAILATLLAATPTVSGPLHQGGKLTAAPGPWSAFQWYRCDANVSHCSSIHGATKPSYTEVAKDVGNTLALSASVTAAGATTVAYSAPAGLVAPPGGLFASAQPALTGDAVVGRSLQVASPAWSSTPAAASYAWDRCNANARLCSPIAGATSATYTVTADDVDHRLLAAVTASAQTVLSLPSPVAAAQAAGPVATVRPSLAGAPQQGKRLSGRAGTWLGSGGITHAFQWYRCDANGAHCSSIHGATKPAYTAMAKDAGATIGLTVRATDSTGTTAAYSSLTGLIAPAASPLAATAQPATTGTKLLEVSTGTWTVTPTAFTYAWLRCNANGRLCSAIAGATANSYAPTAGDRGHTLVATVQATAGTIRQTVLAVATRLI
jgi:hypothetical protein